ncbi:MAG: type II secretion system F family protein, partial [Planctomycetales bacterium]|nr:type II secretion system F family protein [Planctomycetales bacterium]
MTVFVYKAVDARDNAIKGSVVADSARQARDILFERGLQVRDVAEEKKAKRSFLRTRKGTANAVANTLRELATLLSVGVGVVEALDIVAGDEGQNNAMRTSLLSLKDRVSSGGSLAAAMSDQSDIYDELTRHMVEVGEHSGTLDVVLDQVADFKERSLQLKDRVLGAVLYPAIVLGTSMIVVIFLMTVVVPMLLTSLLEANQELPWPTLVLKTMSDTLVHHGFWLLLLGIVSVVGFLMLIRSEKGKLLFDRAVLRVPLVGSMIRKQAISRVAMVISTLLKSGIEYVQAVKIASGSTKNRVLSNGLKNSVEFVTSGEEIGQSLKRTGLFPSVVVHV